MLRVVEVRCPYCGAANPAVPGTTVVCRACGRSFYVPPEPVASPNYENCTPKSKEVEELLERVKRRGATPLEETLLEFYRQTGLLEC